MTGQIKIDVTEINGRFSHAFLHIALGPWPMYNWDWGGKCFFNLDEAKQAKAELEAIKDKDLRYWAYIAGRPYTEDHAREIKANQDKVTKYSL